MCIRDSHISTWATGGVTDMMYLFCAESWDECAGSAAASFNEDISAWDTSGVTRMSSMFRSASAFNQDISAWNTSGVKIMYKMFYQASAFNRDIGDWAVDSVTTMHYMFRQASAFDQNLGWCVGDDVSYLEIAFEDTPCESTSCGVTQGGCAGWFGSSSQTSNGDGVADNDKMMALVVLAGLLGLSLAIAAGLFALRQQQLAAKKPRAPRTFTVTAVQSA